MAPLEPHTNPANSPRNLSMMRIVGSHIHRLEDNWVEHEERMRTGNLPVADPLVSEPASFDLFIEIVAKEFRISGLGRIERPPWQMADLFGI